MSWVPEIRDVAAVAVVLLAVLIIVWCWRRGDFEIRYRGGRVELRGKVPQPHAGAVADFLQHDMQLSGPVTITGLVRDRLYGKPSWVVPDNEPAKRLYFWKDLTAMAASAGVPAHKLMDIFIDADATANPGGWPKGGVTQIDLPNNHLSYAFTWYGLAAVLVVVSVLAFRRKAR